MSAITGKKYLYLTAAFHNFARFFIRTFRAQRPLKVFFKI